MLCRAFVPIRLLPFVAYLACAFLSFIVVEEDAFIYFRLAQNYADGYGLVFNRGGELIESGSGLIWQWLLVGLAALPVHLVVATKCLGVLFAGLSLWMLLFLVLALFLMNEGGYAVRYSNLANQNVLVVIGFGMIGILGMSIFVARRNASGLNEPQLLSVEGRIQIHVDDSGYQVSIGKTFFNVQENISRVFLEGERYRVYYCKSGAYRFILSYEKLDN